MYSKLLTVFQIAGAVALCAGGSLENAGGSSAGLTLQQALALALTKNPQLAAIDYDIRAAEARVLQATLMPNPSVYLTSEDIGGSGVYAGTKNAENTLQLGQLIELGGKRAARIGEAKAEHALAQFDYGAKKRDLFLETHQAFVQVLAGQRIVEVNRQVVALSEAVLPDVRKRIEAGKTSTVEETRFNVAVANASIALEQARRTLETARYRLAAQWGSRQPEFERVVGNLEDAPPLSGLTTLSNRLKDHPKLQRFSAELSQREAVLRKEKAKAVPDLTAGAGVRQYSTGDDGAFVFGLSFPLPLFDRNQGAVRAARQQLAKIEAERHTVEVALQSELADAYQSARAAARQIELFRTTILPQSEDALKATREGYNLGRFSSIELLDAQRTSIAAQQQYVEALVENQQAIARIEGLIGRPLHQAHQTPH